VHRRFAQTCKAFFASIGSVRRARGCARRDSLWKAALLPIFVACSAPEVVVVNQTSDSILIKDVSFSGCRWSEVLKKGDATPVGECLPGDDRIHFKMLDAAEYCRSQAEDATIPGICPCDTAGAPATSVDTSKFGLVNDLPFWFNYQTVSAMRIDHGDFRRIEISS
jgi:hypothetical protein